MGRARRRRVRCARPCDAKVYEPQIRARLGTSAAAAGAVCTPLDEDNYLTQLCSGSEAGSYWFRGGFVAAAVGAVCTPLVTLDRVISPFKDNYFTELCSGSEAGSYLRLIDSCITQLEAQGCGVHAPVAGDNTFTQATCRHHESRRCSRDTHPESYITKYTSIQRLEAAEASAVCTPLVPRRARI